MGNTPSSQGSPATLARHTSLSRHRRTESKTHRPTHHEVFPVPATPSTADSDSALVTTPGAGGGVSPSPNATSPSSLRPTGSPRRRKSLELPDLNRLSLTSMAVSGTGTGTGAITSPVKRSPLALDTATTYVPDTVQQGGAGTGKRLSLMSGTRAQSQSPSAHGHTQTTQEYVQDNPYFPAVPRAVPQPPLTPAALPNYSYSPLDTGYAHTEDVARVPSAPAAAAAAAPRESQDFSSPIQPKAGKPAPAVVTRGTHDHDPITSGQTSGGQTSGAPLVVSGLPQGSTPVSERVRGGEGDTTPHAMRREEERQRMQLQQAAAVRELQRDKEDGGLVPTLVTWNGGGKEVYVTGTFAENGWRTRLKMNKSTHDFSLLLNLPPGTHRIKFIVDDHWRCSNDLQTATDGDGNLVNWLEVDVPRQGGAAAGRDEEDWAQADWAQKVSNELDDDDPALWTDEIPWALVEFQQMEEEALSDPPEDMPVSQHRAYRQRCATILSQLPVPPALPPHLNKVILNVTPKELEGTVGGAAGDDNSILPVPNHVVLNHLTASAIKNDTLAVGTTTRYRRKYISTIYFKPVEDPL